MSYWRFSDGSELKSGAQVLGHTPFAERLSHELVALAFCCAPLVWIAPPFGAVSLDPGCDWLLWRWALQEAEKAGLEVVASDYQESEQDVPEDARKLIARFQLKELQATP